MTGPTPYPLVITLLARKIVATARATFDPPVGLSYSAKCVLMAERDDLWATVEAVGLRDAVRDRIAIAGTALLAEAS